MKKSKKILLFMFISMLFLLSINNIKSSDVFVPPERTTVEGRNATLWYIYNSSLGNITPSYQIIAITNKRTINKGEDFTISYQISGNGKVVANKLITYFPKELLKDNPIYSIYIGDGFLNGSYYRVAWYDEPEIRIGSKEGAFISLVNSTFMKSSPNMDTIYGEEVIDGHRPISIKANSSKNAPNGDHIIKISFIYSDGENWYSSQEEVTIHINSFSEQWEELTFIFGSIIVPILLMFIGLYFAGYITHRWRKDKTNIIENNIIQPKKIATETYNIDSNSNKKPTTKVKENKIVNKNINKKQ